MSAKPTRIKAQWGCLLVLLLAARSAAGTDDRPVTREEFLQLQQQNQQLQMQMQKQQEVIDSLTHKVSELRDAKTADQGTDATKRDSDTAAPPAPAFHLGKVDISGEGAVALGESQSSGQHPYTEFSVDEARLFVEAPVWDDVYFFTELDLATREQNDLALRYGELYLDFEDVSKLWGRDRMLNVRAGRFYIPFGEEYQNRFAIDNPLISHSVADLWGEDNGLELYGSLGPVQYAAAVQNGGVQAARDFSGDKAVSGRVGYDPAEWLHLSVSGMRTGDLNVQKDMLSAMWFGNGFFRSLGGPGTTRFHADAVEADAQVKVRHARFRAAGGYINYGDNDPAGANHRDVYYFSAEGEHDLTSKLYAAARFSEVYAHNGFPIVANGDFPTYLFNELTSRYWRASFGLGYRFSRNLVVKGEYSFNHGREPDGDVRNHEDEFTLEAAFKF